MFARWPFNVDYKMAEKDRIIKFLLFSTFKKLTLSYSALNKAEWSYSDFKFATQKINEHIVPQIQYLVNNDLLSEGELGDKMYNHLSGLSGKTAKLAKSSEQNFIDYQTVQRMYLNVFTDESNGFNQYSLNVVAFYLNYQGFYGFQNNIKVTGEENLDSFRSYNGIIDLGALKIFESLDERFSRIIHGIDKHPDISKYLFNKNGDSHISELPMSVTVWIGQILRLLGLVCIYITVDQNNILENLKKDIVSFLTSSDKVRKYCESLADGYSDEFKSSIIEALKIEQ